MTNSPMDWMSGYFPPLDITVVARRIAELWRQHTINVEPACRSAYMNSIQMGRSEFAFRETMFEADKLAQSIIETLEAYDEGRTRHIEFLKSELMRMHAVFPSPPIVLGLPEELDK